MVVDIATKTHISPGTRVLESTCTVLAGGLDRYFMFFYGVSMVVGGMISNIAPGYHISTASYEEHSVLRRGRRRADWN